MMAENKGSRLAQRIKALAVVILLIVVLIVVQPFLWGAVSGLVEELNQKRFQVKQINKIKSLSKDIEDEYNEQKVFLEQLSAVVPLSRETLQVIERLEGLANEIGAEIKVESIKEEDVLLVGGKKVETKKRDSRRPSSSEEEPKKDDPKLLPLVVSVEVKGRLPVLLSYIESVENVQELTVVKSFALTPSRSIAGSESNEVEYILSMAVVFYLQDYENKGL